jgi:uncharacterized membrane protein YfcA
MMNLLFVLAGFITGFLVGLTGIGGGALMTPMLMFLFGIAPRTAVGTDLWFASFTKIAATKVFLEGGLIEWDIVFKLWIGSLTASAIVLLWLHSSSVPGHEDTLFLKQIIAAAVLWAGIMLFFQPILQYITRYFIDASGPLVDIDGPWGWILTIASGAVLGALVTLTSVGAGALGTAVLLYLYPVRLSPRRLIATEIAHAIPLAIFSGMGHAGLGNVEFGLLIPLLLGSIPGSLLGAYLAARLPQATLKTILSITLLSFGAKLWWMPK